MKARLLVPALAMLATAFPVHAGTCSSYERDRAEHYVQAIGKQIVRGRYNDGNDIRTILTSCSYNSYSKKYEVGVSIHWKGAVFSGNEYNSDGTITMSESGEDYTYEESDFNEALAKWKVFKKVQEILENGSSPGNGSAAALAAPPCSTTTDDNRPTPLMYSAREGDLHNVRCLLNAGADPNTANDGGSTALMFAAQEGLADIVRLLIDRGADINATDNTGLTALLLAAGRGQTDTIRLLLDKGANVNAADAGGETALIRAAKSGHTDTARLLIKHGADVNATDTCGRTATLHARLSHYSTTLETIRNAGGKVFSWRLLSDGTSCIIENLLTRF